MTAAESKTPRTDEAVVSREYIVREMDIYTQKFVLADFARQLESANAELRARIEALAGALKATREKDEHEWNCTVGPYCKTCANLKARAVEMRSHMLDDAALKERTK